MRTIWLVISTVAVANVLAFIGFVLWLKSTDRLSRERIERVRMVFATTLAQEQAAAEEEKARQEAAERALAQQQRMAVPPEPAAARIGRDEEAEQVRLQQLLRQQRELEDLRRTLARERQQINEDAAALARERQEFEEYRRRIAAIEGSAQFKKALATLEAQKPKDAKEVLQALLNQKETDQVVSYLSAMDERIRGRIMAEFVKDRPELAADLLERLRTRGLAAAADSAPAPAP